MKTFSVLISNKKLFSFYHVIILAYKSIFCNNWVLYKFLKNFELMYLKEFLILYQTL